MIDTKIETLLTLLSAGSYTKAAKALSLTQPAVTHHIKMLEQEFQIQIFYKDRKTLKPTPEGELLIKYARRAKALSDTLRQEIEDSRRSIKSFAIGITPTAEENLVPQIFALYCNKHPDVHINIVTDTIKNIDSMLHAFELDMAIIEGQLSDHLYTSMLLDTDYLCLAVSPKHPFAARRSVQLFELKRENFILRSRHAGTRKLFERHLENHSESIRNLNVIMEIDNVATIKELVASNLGITVIAHSACREEIHAGKLVMVPIENMSMVRQINLVCLRDFSHPEMVGELRAFYNEIRMGQ